MINFVKVNSKYYINVLDTMIEPIIKHLDNYKISNMAHNNCINVHFFNENDYRERVKLESNGINVFISHGIADKKYRPFNRMNPFDYVVATGELWKEKHIKEGISESKIFVGGYPKADILFNQSKNIAKPKGITVAWCPTHNMHPTAKGNCSSYPYFNNYIDKLSKKYNVVSSEHPANKTSAKPTINELLIADVVIADIGSTVYESWFMNKPVIFPDWIVRDSIIKKASNTLEGKIYKENIGYHAKNIDELIKLVDIGVNKGLDRKAKELIEGVIPKRLVGNSGKTIADFLVKLENN